MKSMQKGFTLVEIAIVLVIIGLLLGGILKGQEMITQAKIKNLISDFSGVSAAYHGYLDRYRRLPGDDGDANARWTLGIAAPAAGQTFNDGLISGAYASTTADSESRLFWLHLRRAGFVSGTGQDQPFNAVGGMMGVQFGDAAATPAATLTSGGTGFAGFIMCSANIPDKMAIAVDTQTDDGRSAEGSVRALASNAPAPAIGVALAAAAAYAETGTNAYTICRQM